MVPFLSLHFEAVSCRSLDFETALHLPTWISIRFSLLFWISRWFPFFSSGFPDRQLSFSWFRGSSVFLWISRRFLDSFCIFKAVPSFSLNFEMGSCLSLEIGTVPCLSPNFKKFLFLFSVAIQFPFLRNAL